MCLVNVSIEKVATTSLNFYYKLISISYYSPKLFVRKIQIVIEYSLSPQKTPELFCCSSLSTFLLRICNFATCSWVIEFSDYVLSNWNFYSPTLQLTKDPTPSSTPYRTVSPSSPPSPSLFCFFVLFWFRFQFQFLFDLLKIHLACVRFSRAACLCPVQVCDVWRRVAFCAIFF